MCCTIVVLARLRGLGLQRPPGNVAARYEAPFVHRFGLESSGGLQQRHGFMMLHLVELV